MNPNSSHPTNAELVASSEQDQAELWQQMAAMKAELEQYKAEVAALRQEVDLKRKNEVSPAPQVVAATSRRRMLKHMVAGAAGISALSIAAMAGLESAQAETSGDNAIDAQAGPSGYGGKFTSNNFAQIQLVPGGTLPTDFTGHNLGELFVNSAGSLYFSISTSGGNTPNAWRKISGPKTAGTFHLLLPTSDRFVDTRPGAENRGGRNTPLTGSGTGTGYTFQITGVTGRNGQTDQIIPAGATAVLGNITLLAASGGSGPVKVLPGNATDFTLGTAPIIYGGATSLQGAFSAALGPSGDLKVVAFNSGSFDLLIDIVGYFA